MSSSHISHSAEVALLTLGGLAAAMVALWLYREDGAVSPNIFLCIALSVAAFVDVWRGSKLSSLLLFASVGVYFWWLAGLSFSVGAIGIPSRTVPAALAHRAEWPVLFWLVLAIYGAIGSLGFWAATSQYRASRRLFR